MDPNKALITVLPNCGFCKVVICPPNGALLSIVSPCSLSLFWSVLNFALGPYKYTEAGQLSETPVPGQKFPSRDCARGAGGGRGQQRRLLSAALQRAPERGNKQSHVSPPEHGEELASLFRQQRAISTHWINTEAAGGGTETPLGGRRRGSSGRRKKRSRGPGRAALSSGVRGERRLLPQRALLVRLCFGGQCERNGERGCERKSPRSRRLCCACGCAFGRATMPFLGQDWRSPGQSWVKTADGWTRFLDGKDHPGGYGGEWNSYSRKEECNKENIFNSLNCDVAAKKRKKDQLNNKTRIQYFHQEKWIYVHKGSTKERHGYCTLGEAFNRLDFSNAILDSRRFNYVVRLLELIAKSQLTSLSGIAQKNFMNILEKVVQKVLEDQQNIRLIKELLQTLYMSLCTLVQSVGKSVLVGNINMWVHRMETILHWQQQLNNIQITRPTLKGLTFTDLPLCLQLNIMQRLTDGRDIVSLGQVTPSLQVLSEDRLLWKKLCHYHFTDRQIRKRLILSDKGHLDWKKMYFKLVKCYPRKEQYGDSLQLCRHCHVLSWKGTDHPCTANNPESCLTSLSPQDFINLFRF